ncbi:MAG: Na+/H+ antiporter subunit E [Lachnospiraceae bacterium]|nr:Na+/H+ antiporter subunit E [Lachnospiraceae bacterium]
MFLLFFVLWVVFNGQFTFEIAVFGIIISLAMHAFICRFMNFSLKRDLSLIRCFFYFLYFSFILIIEIIKANLVMAKFIIIKQEYELHPVIIKMNTCLETRICRVLLANSITLTPGTITISLSGNELIIHAIDESLAIEDDGDFIFEKILLKMEKIGKGVKS